MENEILLELIASLEPYNTIDLLSAVAGLQLMPINADQATRLEVLACVVASMPSNADTKRISSPRLKYVCNRGALATSRLTMMEDPCDNLFTEALTYHGGSYIVFPGIAEEPVYIAKHLIRVITLMRLEDPSSAFAAKAHKLITGVLTLSNEIAIRANLKRNVDPATSRHREVTIPPAAQFATLKQAVTISREQCHWIFGTRGVELGDISELFSLQGSVDIECDLSDGGQIAARPIVQNGDVLIVAAPGMLVTSLINILIHTADKYGLRDQIADRFNASVWESTSSALSLCNNVRLIGAPLQEVVAPCVRQGVFSLDTDKLLYVLIISDSLNAYDPEQPFSSMPIDGIDLIIESQLAIARAQVMEQASITTALYLVVVQSLGRSVTLSIESDGFTDPELSLLLYMTASELELICQSESADQLGLWKFARARTRIRSSANVMSIGTLNEFQYYRQRHCSYYFDDDRRPTMILLHAGGAGVFRREVIKQRDWHAVVSHANSNRIVEVTTVHGTATVPIYFDPNNVGRQTAIWLETPSISAWVIGPELENQDDRTVADEYHAFADAAAYWLWQCSPSLTACSHLLMGEHQYLLVRINLPTNEDWRSVQLPENNGVDAIDVTQDLDNKSLDITIHSSMTGMCAASDNRGERLLVSALLLGLSGLLPDGENSLLSAVRRETILEAHAPIGTKRKLYFQTSNLTPELNPAGILPFRAVQEADINEVLDELGTHLVDAGFQTGPIPAEQSGPVLRDTVVPFLYDKLQSFVESLSPDGLLEALIGANEAVTFQTNHNEKSIHTRLACYGDDAAIRKSMTDDIGSCARSAIALRFLIEYVAARPPAGAVEVSLGALDHLTSIAALIVDFGFDCDLINYDLAQVRHSLLPSGRFGTSRDLFVEQRSIYIRDLMDDQITSRVRRHASTMLVSSPGDQGYADLFNPVDAAGVEEFGVSITDIVQFTVAATSLSAEADAGVSVLSCGEFVSQLSESLSWGRQKVEIVLDLLALSKRDNFLAPPAPFTGIDTYPWRFNRRLSHLRRPLVIRGSADEREVIWGSRNTSTSGRFLISLCTEGRLKADSKPMRQALGAITTRQGVIFNNLVADLAGMRSGWQISRRVTGFGKLRIPEGLSGDMDVLIVDLKTFTFYVLECKDIASARTPYEIATQTEQLIKNKNGKRSAVDQVTEQANWLRQNLPTALEWLRLDTRRKWKVETRIVVDQVMPAPYLMQSPVRIISFETFRTIVLEGKTL